MKAVARKRQSYRVRHGKLSWRIVKKYSLLQEVIFSPRNGIQHQSPVSRMFTEKTYTHPNKISWIPFRGQPPSFSAVSKVPSTLNGIGWEVHYGSLTVTPTPQLPCSTEETTTTRWRDARVHFRPGGGGRRAGYLPKEMPGVPSRKEKGTCLEGG